MFKTLQLSFHIC